MASSPRKPFSSSPEWLDPQGCRPSPEHMERIEASAKAVWEALLEVHEDDRPSVLSTLLVNYCANVSHPQMAWIHLTSTAGLGFVEALSGKPEKGDLN